MQISRNAAARNGLVERFGIGQLAPALRSDAAFARQHARDLAHPIGAKVEADAGVFVANCASWLAALIGDYERHHELIGNTLVVGILDSLHGIGIASAFAAPFHHGGKSFFFARPAAVAIHGVVAAVDAGDSAAKLAELLLELLQIARAAGGQRVASIHEGVHENALNAALLGHL